MSVRVELNDVPVQLGRFGAAAFLVTVGDDGRPHPASVRVEAADGVLRAGAGRRTRVNVEQRRDVTLLWAGPVDGYGLLVDGTAAIEDESVVVTPTSAILHKLQEA
jgi:hypothetical protein